MLFEAFVREAARFRSVAILSHVRPDADAIGSQTALALWFAHRGVKVRAFNDDTLPPNLAWMSNHFFVEKTDPMAMADVDAFILVDGNAFHRFGKAGESAKSSGKPVLMIDHHPQPDPGFAVLVSVETASSTCELVFRLYRETGLEALTTAAAESIYAGMMTDTGSFRFDSVTADTHQFVSELIRRTDIRVDRVHRRIFDGRRFEQIQLLGDVLRTLTLHQDGRLATLRVTRAMLAERGCVYADLDGFVNYGLGVAGVQASILACEIEDGVKLSLRSVEPVDVNAWARNFDGGGHVRAAGARHPGPLDQTIRDLLATSPLA
jgi:bifunctional oligoribonuclease and PAP phosphatase NrnA